MMVVRALRRFASNGRLDEGDGWVNWSGLATLMANADDMIAIAVDCLLCGRKARSLFG